MSGGDPSGLDDSLWAATCAPQDHPALDGEVSADVAVVGAGFAGLSAALHLARAGRSVAVLEARAPGWGASGRNGGQVIPGLKADEDALRRAFGAETARRAAAACDGSAAFLFDLVESCGIDCDLRRGGWIQAASNQAGLAKLHARCGTRAGRAAGLEPLDAAEIARRTGAAGYLGGLLDPRAGVVHPLKLADGLARAAVSAGARIFAGSPARTVTGEAGDLRVASSSGAVRCRCVVLCANAYADDLFPAVRRSVVPVVSLQAATDPLPSDLADQVMPDDVAASDIRRLTTYFRRDPEGRLLFGGRGTFSARANATLFGSLRAEAERRFPQIRGRAVWRHAWGGRVAMTDDGLPRISEPAPGIVAGFGFNGRGVAMAARMGAILAARASGAAAEDLDFPLTPMRPIRFHRFHRAGVALTVGAWRALDRVGL